ncbi:MAG: TauD/TfdA family dioxygenase [Acidobacteriota bacterium]|nr:TauD/TfdA family dioxygenase [Acidobacteriota bacterium]
MSIGFRKLHPLIGAEVSGVDLARTLDRATVEAIRNAWSRYGVLLFRRQPITDEQQVAFSRHFGSLEIFPQAANRSRAVPEIFRVTNVGDDNRIRPVDSPGGRYSTLICVWHTDSSYRRVPSKGAVLHAIEVVSKGGDTLFANMCHAYRQLPAELKSRIAGLRARHSFQYSRQLRQLPPMDPAEAAQVPPVDHPLVRRLRDGRLSLYVSATYMERILGLSEVESGKLIDELMDWATQDTFVYRHRWHPHDILMWDNRWCIHVVIPFDHGAERRVMHRTTIAGTEPVEG